LNKDSSTNDLTGRRLPAAIGDGVAIAVILGLVFDIVAGRQDLQQTAAGDLLPGRAAARTRVS
jgi:hypothetical protein